MMATKGAQCSFSGVTGKPTFILCMSMTRSQAPFVRASWRLLGAPVLFKNRGVDTGLTENTRLTEIRQSGPFSNFNSTLHNLRVLKYKFEIVTIVQVDHILNLKKKLALYMQYKLSSILFKKTVLFS